LIFAGAGVRLNELLDKKTDLSRKRVLAAIFLTVIAATVGWGAYLFGRLRAREVAIGQAMPDFDLTNLDGRRISSPALRGQKYAVLFAREGCPHCARELAELKAVLPSFEGRFVIIVAFLNTPDQTREAVKGLGLPTSLFYYESDRLGRSLNLRGVPTLVLVDEAGIIRYAGTGSRAGKSQEALLNRFIRSENVE
jgi:peroxiredoxin